MDVAYLFRHSKFDDAEIRHSLWNVIVTAFLSASSWFGITQVVQGACEGTFWVDRWNQGRFAPYGFVDESVFERLRKHTAFPVRLTSPQFRQDEESGPRCLMEFGTVERLQQPLSIHLRWLEGHTSSLDSPVCRMRSPQEAVLEVEISNKADAELILDMNECNRSRRLKTIWSNSGFSANSL